MPQIEFPTRRIPCATLALAGNVNHFYVRKADRDALPMGVEATYVRAVSGTETRSQVSVHPHPTAAQSYQLFTTDPTPTLIDPVAASFTLELDVGVIVNYPSRPILRSPGLKSNTTITNPLDVRAWDIGEARYEGSFEMDVPNHTDVPIVEAFVDQLYDPRNWFEMKLPGSHLGVASVSSYDVSTGDIGIGSTSEDNYHGYWARVGNRTARIVYHRVGVAAANSGFAYTHTIRIVPSGLITGTTASEPANNFARHETMRVRAQSVTARGDTDFEASWTIQFVETLGG